MIRNHERVKKIKAFLHIAATIALSAVCLASCKIYKPTYYFKDIQRDTVINGFIPNDLELKIQKNDILAISVTSLNPLEDALYNTPAAVGVGLTGFQVDRDGSINFHKIGKLMVAGLTRQDLKTKLEADLTPYLKDPIASVSFANHRVTVFGEKTSTVVEMPQERIPLVEVMAKSGASTPDSRLNSVMVIRETGNSKEFKHLNLEDPSIFTSSWYYLQPNDIVVVKPNEEKISTEQRRARNQLIYTTVLSVITFIFLISDRFN